MELIYHSVDTTWSVWTTKSFEDFVEKWVIKGRFHLGVPQDVVKSFLVAEYIMAHSWYHYPLYDEALTKIAGIVEMAVKLRCRQLELPLTARDKNGTARKMRLVKLMDAIVTKEPGKEMDFILHHMRRVRNIVAHPEHFGYAGGTQWHIMLHCVNLLNMLFMSEAKCIAHNEEKKRVNELLKKSFPGCSILYLEEKRYLVENVHITLALDPGGAWRYLLIAHPLYIDLKQSFKAQSYLPLFCYEVKNLRIENEMLIAEPVQGEALIKIEPTTEIANLEVYNRYIKAKASASAIDIHIFESATSHEPKLAESEMYYRYGELF